MSIGREEVRHVARLAELAVKENELDRLVEQLNRIVDYVAQLEQVPGDAAAEPFLPGPRARRRCGKTCRARSRSRVPAGGYRAGVRRGLLPGAAARRDGGRVSAAARRPRRPAQRLAAADAAGLNATLHWSQRAARRRGALVSTRRRRAGRSHAMPIALKDNIVTTEQPTTCASRILEGYTSPYNATAVDRLRAAGAMIAAKANMDEFAMGSSTEHSAFGRVRHPLDPTGYRAARRAARRRSSPPASFPPRWARRPAARCGSRRASAASSA